MVIVDLMLQTIARYLQMLPQLPNTRVRTVLDIGGGIGSFAVHMSQYGVEVLTTTVQSDKYLQTVANRGFTSMIQSYFSPIPAANHAFDMIHARGNWEVLRGQPDVQRSVLAEWNP